MEIHQIKRCMVQIVLLAGSSFKFFSWHCYMLFVPYGWDWRKSLLLGGLLSATDPVAVVALLKDLGASKNLSTTMKGESLMNDGVALGAVALGLVSVLWLGIIFNDTLIEITLTLKVRQVYGNDFSKTTKSQGRGWLSKLVAEAFGILFKDAGLDKSKQEELLEKLGASSKYMESVLETMTKEQLLNARAALGEIDVEAGIMNNLLELHMEGLLKETNSREEINIVVQEDIITNAVDTVERLRMDLDKVDDKALQLDRGWAIAHGVRVIVLVDFLWGLSNQGCSLSILL
eukprot:Gb_41047 [translate_table: standard]